MSSALLINSTDLDLWARRLEARSQLPRLLGRLVRATVPPDVRRVGFPADEGVQLSGWDGVVQTDAGNEFVPAGISVWEMGANSNVKRKADEDYEKRCKDPEGANPAESTYIFVTPRRWGGKARWVQKRNEEGTWREVRAYDAEDLAQWLEEAPGVHLWFSELLGRHPQGACSLDDFWKNWADETGPPLHPDLVIGGREEARRQVLDWLHGAPSASTLQGDSFEEAAAFLAAVVQGMDAEERVAVLARTVVVDDAASWRRLALSSAPLLLIPRFDQPEGIGQVVQNGHHVFVPLGRTGATGALPLPRLVRDAAERALMVMGFSHERASDFATLARRSLSALRRKLAVAPGVQVPAWAKPNETPVLLAPLLVGAWQDSSEGDRNALSQLAGISYEDLQRVVVRWANEPDPPLRRVGDVWMVAAREDAWRLIARYLTDDDLKRFEIVTLDVLGERDPALELPTEKRFAASIYGKVLTRSEHLREGVAETLALMATLSPEVQFAASPTGEDVARKIVSTLLEKAKKDQGVWASLSYKLPLLAEAAPGVFLDAVDAGLVGESPMLVQLFQDQTQQAFWMSSSPHTGLLWALETLAWNAEHLGRAALSLARLARLDPGGQLGNRPEHSLRDIFLCWNAHTAAPLNRRLAVLDAIRKREPEAAWQLLIRLLPKHHGSVSPTHKPQWRDWVPDPRTPVTVQEYIESTDAVLERLLSDVQTSVSHWCDLITAAGEMTLEQREKFLSRLDERDPEVFSSDERAQARDCLRKVIAQHREFPDTEWAMPAEHVDRLERVYDCFEPEDLVARHSWLFADWDESPEVIEGLREAALREVVDTHGWDGVLRLAEQAEEPGHVGRTLGRSDLLPIDKDMFLRENLAAPELWRSQMTRSFVLVCTYKYGEPWIESCLAVSSGVVAPSGCFQIEPCDAVAVAVVRVDEET